MRTRSEIQAERADVRARMAKIRSDVSAVSARADRGETLDAGDQERLDNLTSGFDRLKEQDDDLTGELRADLSRRIDTGSVHLELDGEEPPQGRASFDGPTGAVRTAAMRALERNAKLIESDAQPRLEKLVRQQDVDGVDSRYLVAVSDPAYERAFGRMLSNPLTAQFEMDARELAAVRTVRQSMTERAMAEISGASGQFALPIALDPTILSTRDPKVCAFRDVAKVITISTYQWKGVTSTGVTASYAAEGTEATDSSPTLLQPAQIPERVQCFVPFSFELSQDWGALLDELAKAFQESKDDLEAQKFTSGAGHGSAEPQGLITGITSGSTVSTLTNDTFATADLYALEQALGPKYQARARMMGNRAIFNAVRQFDVYGGAQLWTQLATALAPELIGYPIVLNSAMDSATTDAKKILVLGDFNYFQITDRIGASIELVPHLFGTANNYPTGQRGLFGFWRNTSGVLDSIAFRLLKIQ